MKKSRHPRRQVKGDHFIFVLTTWTKDPRTLINLSYITLQSWDEPCIVQRKKEDFIVYTWVFTEQVLMDQYHGKKRKDSSWFR